MGRTEIKIEGFKELKRRIDKLDGKLRRKVYNEATKKAGKIVVAAAQAKVPVRTGSVRKSIAVRASSKPSKGLFGVKVSVKSGLKSSNRTARRSGYRGVGGGQTYHPDAVERYYRFPELGFTDRGGKFRPAKAYLKPALEDKAGAVLNAMKESLAAALERETQSL